MQYNYWAVIVNDHLDAQIISRWWRANKKATEASHPAQTTKCTINWPWERKSAYATIEVHSTGNAKPSIRSLRCYLSLSLADLMGEKRTGKYLKQQVKKRIVHLIFTYLEPSCTHQSSDCQSASRWHRKPPPSLLFPLSFEKRLKRQEGGSPDLNAPAISKNLLPLTEVSAFLFGREVGRKPRIWIANTPFQCSPFQEAVVGRGGGKGAQARVQSSLWLAQAPGLAE